LSSDVIGFVVTVSQGFVDSLSRHDALRAQLGDAGITRASAELSRRLLELGRELVDAERERHDPHIHRLHHALAEAWLRTAVQPASDQTMERDTLAHRFQALVE